jgi:hypothetical protein
MFKKLPIFLAAAALLMAALACNAILPSTPGPTSLTNARTAFDQDGNNPTTTFAPGDDFYVVFDVNDGKLDDAIDARWYGEEVEGDGPTYMFYEQNYVIEEEVASIQTVYFQIYNTDGDWPAGPYKVELYLNGLLVQTIDFEVR